MKYVAEKGDSIHIAAKKVIDMALKKGVARIELVFNDITIHVHYMSFEEDIATIYFLKHKLNQIGS